MEETQKPILGTAPIPNAEFKLDASDFVFLQNLKQFYMNYAQPFNSLVAGIESLEQKFIADGNLVYIYEGDVEELKDETGKVILGQNGKAIPKLTEQFHKRFEKKEVNPVNN